MSGSGNHALFEGCDGIYLLNHSVGRPPRGAHELLRARFFAPWENGDGDPWAAWLTLVEVFRGALAELLHSHSENFCPQSNVSSALAKVVASLPRREGRDQILLSEDDFPSIGFVLEQAERLGYRCRFLPPGAPLGDVAYWEQELRPQVAVALLTHVQSNTSRLLPVAEILALARARGVTSVVDVAQSAGVIPIDIEAWNADFVIGSCVKWLCGGPGAGWLWVNPAIVSDCLPLDVGWFSHENPFEMRIRDFRYHPGALRFWGGTPSVLPAALATIGIRTVLSIGVTEVRAANLALTQMLIDAAGGQVLVSPQERTARGGTVVLHFGERQAAVTQKLQSAAVRFDQRASGIRLSPHVYNTAAEMDTVLRCFR